MGQGLSEEFKDDGVARIQFSKTLTNWFLESGFAKDTNESIAGHFFVYLYSKEARQKKHFPWKARICIITNHQILIVKARTLALRMQQQILYEQIDDLMYAPQCQLVKISLKSDNATLYLSAGRCELPEQMVATISYFQNEIKQSTSPAYRPLSRYGSLAQLSNEENEVFVEDDAPLALLHESATLKSQQFKNLSSLWKELYIYDIKEDQLWEGSIDLLALMYTISSIRKFGEPIFVKPTEGDEVLTYFVAVIFPIIDGAQVEHALFRTSNFLQIKDLVVFICKKYNIPDPDSYYLYTLSGLLLHNTLTLADYGLGSLFLTWQVKLRDKKTSEKTRGVSQIEIILPEKAEFFGAKSTAIEININDKVQHLIDKISRKYHLDDDCFLQLFTLEGLCLFTEETLEQHGFGNLYKKGKKMSLKLELVKKEDTLRRRLSLQVSPRQSNSWVSAQTTIIPRCGILAKGETRSDRHSMARIETLELDENNIKANQNIKTSGDSIPNSNNKDSRLKSIRESLNDLSSEQLSAVENFIISMKNKPTDINNSTIPEVGPIYHQKFDEDPVVNGDNIQKRTRNRTNTLSSVVSRLAQVERLSDSSEVLIPTNRARSASSYLSLQSLPNQRVTRLQLQGYKNE